ncbi:MAG: hypothetical protein K2J30_05845, partial [Clostridia bacterium]|nr:hypothetical protein [Clostridia bacterium]
MKKKLFPTALALACALTCTFSLAACDLGGSNTTQTNGDITATSIEAEEVALKANVSGWKFTDSTEGDMTDRYCIDLYVYVNTTEQYSAFRYNNTDFTANGVSPDSINEVGEKKILNASYTFNDYMLDNGAPYTAKSTSTTNGNDTDGYTETWGATYHKTVSSELSRNVHYIQRYVLQFESPVVAGTIKYKNST